MAPQSKVVKAAAAAAVLASQGAIGADVSTEGGRCRQVLRIAEARTDLERGMLCRASEVPQECESARAMLGSAPFSAEGVTQVCSEWPNRRMEQALEAALLTKSTTPIPQVDQEHLDKKSLDEVLALKDDYDKLNKTEKKSVLDVFVPELTGLFGNATNATNVATAPVPSAAPLPAPLPVAMTYLPSTSGPDEDAPPGTLTTIPEATPAPAVTLAPLPSAAPLPAPLPVAMPDLPSTSGPDEDAPPGTLTTIPEATPAPAVTLAPVPSPAPLPTPLPVAMPDLPSTSGPDEDAPGTLKTIPEATPAPAVTLAPLPSAAPLPTPLAAATPVPGFEEGAGNDYPTVQPLPTGLPTPEPEAMPPAGKTIVTDSDATKATALWSMRSSPVVSGSDSSKMSQGFVGAVVGAVAAAALGMVARFVGNRRGRQGMSTVPSTGRLEDGMVNEAAEEDSFKSTMRGALE